MEISKQYRLQQIDQERSELTKRLYDLDVERKRLIAVDRNILGIYEEPVDILGFSAFTLNKLKNNGIMSVKQLVDASFTDIAGVRSVGVRVIQEIYNTLAEYGVAWNRAECSQFLHKNL